MTLSILAAYYGNTNGPLCLPPQSSQGAVPVDGKEMAQRESALSRRIMKALRDKYGKELYVWKIHGGPLTPAGLPDIVGVYKGQFFGLETKMPGGKGPSVIQLHVHERLRAAGARVGVPRGVPDALSMFAAWFDQGDV